jgi:hypothetical protein
MTALGRACVKTPARFHTNLFRSLFRGRRAFRIGKIAKDFALRECLQNFAEFPHGLGRFQPIMMVCKGRKADNAQGGSRRPVST